MKSPLALMLSSLTLLLSGPVVAQEKVVIAHRGASGYLPEHTLEAKAMAHAQGAHYLEQDVVMTRDDQLVVLHDLTLERTTDVADKFPGRAREDGRFYVIDFSLEELRQLRVSEARIVTPLGRVPAFPGRFPIDSGNFRINTLAEEIALTQGLNRTTGREAGIYPELKAPWFHHQEGKDLARAVLEELRRFGYTNKDSGVFLQTFDYHELKRVKEELLPAMDMDIPLVQLVAENSWGETFERVGDGTWQPYDYGWMHEAEGMATLARHADGVGPAMNMVVEEIQEAPGWRVTPLVERAHAAGMVVHPYTFRLDAGRIPGYAGGDFDRLLEIFLREANVDGIFTDFPDRALYFLAQPL